MLAPATRPTAHLITKLNKEVQNLPAYTTPDPNDTKRRQETTLYQAVAAMATPQLGEHLSTEERDEMPSRKQYILTAARIWQIEGGYVTFCSQKHIFCFFPFEEKKRA